MQSTFRKRPLPFVFSAAVLALNACNFPAAGPDQHESRSIDLDKSEEVHAQLKMPVGDLTIRGGAAKLMDADFTYNVPAWKPDIRYSSAGATGDLFLEQHGSSTSLGNTKNNWDLRFNNDVPLDLRIEFGAGDAHLTLGSLNLRGVDLKMGAGDLHMDLRGNPKKDYSVRARGGAGDATIYLPKDVGISARAKGGVGDVSVTGLHQSGDHYENDAYDRAAVRIRLDIQGGVGSIRLIAE